MEIKGTNCEWIWTGDYLKVTTEDLSGSIIINDEITIGIPPNTISKFNNIIIAGTKMPSFNDGATAFNVDDFAIKEAEMKTSYEGCNKEIADSLKRGEHIKCYVGHNDKQKTVIVAYSDETYISKNHECYFIATPIKKETYVIDAVSMMQGLIERGYKVNEYGTWEHNEHKPIYVERWQYCGKRRETCHIWQSWMLVEREI